MNNKIVPFYHSTFSSDELVILGRRLGNGIVEFVTNDTDGQLVSEFVCKSTDLLEDTIEKSRKNVYTPVIHEKIDVMDNLISYIKYMAKAGLYHPEMKEVMVAGNRILSLLQEHLPYPSKLGNAKKVSKIDYLGKTLLSDKYSTYCDTLGLTESVKKLEAVKNEYEHIFNKKVAVETDDSVTVGMASEECIDAFETLFGYVKVRALLDENGTEGVIETINEIIEEVTVMSRTRRTRLEQEKEEQELTNNQNTESGEEDNNS